MAKYYYNNKYYFFGDENSSLLRPSSEFNVKSLSKNGYDSKVTDYYMNRRDYESAARYLEMFHFTDPRVEQEHRTDIALLRMEGRKQKALYDHVETPEQKWALDFTEKVFRDRGLETLDDRDNSFGKRFKDLKQHILGENAAKVSIEFQPKKQYVDFGLFKVDWLSKDNDNTIENFMEAIGRDANNLRNNGIDIDLTNRTISFNPSNPLANDILYTLGETNTVKDSLRELYGLDTNATNTGLSRLFSNRNVNITSYNEKGEKIQLRKNTIGANDLLNQNADTSGILLSRLAEVVDDAKNAGKEVYNNTTSNNFTYSTDIYGYVSDEYARLAEAHRAGLLSNEDFNSLAKDAQSRVHNQLIGSGFSQTPVYANWENGGATELETMVELDTDERQKLKRRLTEEFKAGNVVYQFAVSGDDVGTYVTIMGHKGTGDDKSVYKPVYIFLPGFLAEEAKQRIGSDDGTRAVMELHNMERWGYDYGLNDGSYVYFSKEGLDQNGVPIVVPRHKQSANDVGEAITREKALQLVTTDNYINSSVRQLTDKYTNTEGKLINKDKLDEELKLLTTILINNVDTSVDDLTTDDIFKKYYKKLDDGRTLLDGKEISYKMYDKISEAERIYYQLLHAFDYLR